VLPHGPGEEQDRGAAGGGGLHPVPGYRLTVGGDGAGAALIHLVKEPVMSFVVPGACTLPTVDRPPRRAEFGTLLAAAAHARTLSSGPAW
jgi:hypothetical protein